MPTPKNVRRIALDLLSGCAAGRYSNLALDAAIKKHSLIRRPGACNLLVIGLSKTDNQTTIDKLSALPRENQAKTYNLRLGLYQPFYRRIPDHGGKRTVSRPAPGVRLCQRAPPFLRNATISPPSRDGTPNIFRSNTPSLPGCVSALSEFSGPGAPSRCSRPSIRPRG